MPFNLTIYFMLKSLSICDVICCTIQLIELYLKFFYNFIYLKHLTRSNHSQILSRFICHLLESCWTNHWTILHCFWEHITVFDIFEEGHAWIDTRTNPCILFRFGTKYYCKKKREKKLFPTCMVLDLNCMHRSKWISICFNCHGNLYLKKTVNLIWRWDHNTEIII